MKITVAAVQMVSKNNDFEGNRLRAETYISQAVDKGAKLILLPEFALAGYLYTDDFWSMAEPLKGKTYLWLKSLSERYGVYIGTCILERDPSDFYDTFILTGPGQNQLWTHRKIEAPSYESYLFKGDGINSNVFETPIGRIGVVICFDSAKAHTLSGLIKGNAEIVLIAYSFPCLPHYFTQKDRRNWTETYLNAPRIYSERLHAPVVVSNKSGRFSSPVPIGIGDFDSDFAGGSSICGKDSTLLCRLDKNQTGVLVSEVTLGEGLAPNSPSPIRLKGWLLPFCFKTRAIMEVNRKLGTARYRFSKKRKQAANASPWPHVNQKGQP